MLRIDPGTALDVQMDANGEGKHGFQPGDPQTGREPTQVTYIWLNNVQEEIANAIEGFGVPLNPNQKNQLFNVLHGQFLRRDGAGLTGVLLGKQGAVTPNNTNNAGYGFAGDPDTGMFSGTDGTLQFASNGSVVMQTAVGGAIQFLKAVLAPKGLPSASDTSYIAGYAFAGDNDTGVFARGGTTNTLSDVCLINDSIVAASVRGTDKAFVVETKLVAVDASGTQKSSTHFAAGSSLSGDLPVSAFADTFSYDFTARGPYLSAGFYGYLKMSAANSLDVVVEVRLVRLSDAAVLDSCTNIYGVLANSNSVESASGVGQVLTSAQLVAGQNYRILVRAYKNGPYGPLVLKNMRIDGINS